MKRGKITWLLFIFICICAVQVSAMFQGQLTPNVDSLQALLDETKGEEQVKILLELSDQTRRSNIDSAIAYAQKAADSSGYLGADNLQGESYRKLGRLLSRNGEHPAGLQHLLEAKQIFEDLGNSEKRASTLDNIGALYRRQSDYHTALEYYYQALELKEQQGNQTNLTQTLIRIGVANEELNQLPKAITFYQRALEISKSHNNTSEIAITAVQLGNAFARMGKMNQALESVNTALEASEQLPGEHARATILLDKSELYKEKKSFQQAITANQKAFELANQMSDYTLQAHSLRNIAAIHDERGDLKTANDYLLRAFTLFDRSGMREEGIQTQNQIASHYLGLEEYEESVEMAERALESAEKTGFLKLQQRALEILVEGYRRQGGLNRAISVQEKILEVKDSLFDQAKSWQTAEMQTRYETEQKEKEIALLQNEKEQEAFVKTVLLVGFILIGIIGGLAYNRQRLKIKKNRAELKNTRLKEQKLEQDLQFKNKQLTTHTLHLVQKNEAMKELKEKIGTIRQQNNGNINKSLQKLRNLVDYSFNLDEDWEKFRLYFEEIHDSFFDALKEKYPNLTPNELRLSALAKLNLTVKETATIMGITPNSVKTARYRLRKKIGMETEKNLNKFMMEIEKEARES